MMKQTTLKLLLSLAVALTAFGSAFAQKYANPYEAREKGYYVGIMESKSGLVATSIRADEIYLVKDGSAKMLVNTRNCGMYMQMSKDGKLVGFKSISDDYTKQAPAVVDVTTGKVTLLEPYSRECGQVSFSDDGTMAYMLGNSLVIRKGNDKRTFDMGVYVNIVNLSPDGKKAAFTTIEGESFIVDTATGVKSRVDIQGNATYNPIWAPDGKKIAYQRIDGTLSVMNLETKALYNIGEASSPVWTPDSKEIIFVRAQRENDIFVPSASVIKTSFDGTKANVIVARSANVPVAVATTTDGGLAISYAVGEQRGIYKIAAERNGRLRSASTATSVLAAKDNVHIGSEYKVNHNIVKDIPKNTEAHPLTDGSIGYLDIPYINQVWDTPADHAGCYDYGYVCCAPSSSCMNLGYFKLLNPHAVQSRKVNATAYYSWYVGRDYTSPITGYVFNERVSVNRGWYGCTSSSVGGGYAYMWNGSSPSSSMHNYYKKNGMKNSYFQSSWSTFVTEVKANRPYTICLKNSTDGHVVLGFRTNCYVPSGGSTFVNATGCFVCHDPYGDYNHGYPNWDGRYSSYDWPGYNTGHKNIGTFYWGCVAIPPDNPTPTNPKITFSPSTINFTCKVNEHPSTNLTVTGTDLSSDITVASVTPGRFSTSVTSLPASGGTVKVTFNISDKAGTYGPGGTAVDYDFYIRLVSGSANVTVPVRATVTEDNTPKLTASASSLSFTCSPMGCGPGDSPTKTVKITGTNLKGDINLAISGTNANLFSVSPTTISKSAGSGTVTVTYTPTSVGNHSATLTASSSGATSVNVALSGKASDGAAFDESQCSLTVIKESQSSIVARADGRYSTGYGEYIYLIDKANGQVVRYNKSGTKSVYASVDGIGTAITSDDAGNILVNKGFAGVGSSTNWVIIEPNGTQTALTLNGFTAARLDDVGRVVGNVASSQGGYLYLTPQNQNAVIAVKIANKAFVSATSSPATDVTFDASTVAQPIYKTVAEVEAASNKACTAYFRKRTDKNIWSWNGTSATSLGAIEGSTPGDGFDVFELGGVKYGVEPASGSNNYGDGIAIRNLSSNAVLASKNLNLVSEANPSFVSITARVNDDEKSVTIYQNLAGKLVAMYRWGMPEGSTTQTVATPTFSPAAGTYTSAQNVTIACGTSGAEIHYTLDGSNPTASSTKYTAPITISATTTVKAIAVKSGMNNSAVASATYTINNSPTAPATPTFSPAAGTYTSAQNVTIACATEGAEIRYTLDGSNPTASSALFNGPIVISTTTTVKAIAIKSGVSSSVATAVYTIQGSTPPEPPVASGLTKVWEQKFTTPASSDARFATGFGAAVYAAQKATDDAPGKILKYTKTGVTTFATVEGMGSAITSDDAGNILVNKGFPNATSAANWVIIEPNGTQHELTLTMPDGMESKRLDQVGRVVGNVMSSTGGYFFLAYSEQTAVAAIKIVNGQQDTSASAASPTVAVILNTSSLAQPMFSTVEETEAWVDPSTAFYSRNRGANKIFSWLEDGSEQYAMDNSFGSGGNEGFDVFEVGSKLYGVVSTARTTEFTLRNITDAEEIEHAGSASDAVSHQFRAYTVRKESNGVWGIYVWNAGFSAEYYTYGDSGVDSIGNDAVEIATTYYNLQGIRVTSPTVGQIYIRVANLSDGSVRTSKVVIR